MVVAKQAADAKNARYICKNNTLSFFGCFFLFRDKTYIRRIQNRTKQKGFIDRSRLHDTTGQKEYCFFVDKPNAEFLVNIK